MNPVLSLSIRIYRALLLAYPRAFRREYGALMTQLFRDQCRDVLRQDRRRDLLRLWRRTLIDTAVNASQARWAALQRIRRMSKRGLLFIGLALVLSVLIGYVNLNASEAQAPMFCLLFFGGLIGFLQPKAAWRWGVLLGLSIPLSYVIGLVLRYPIVDPPHDPLSPLGTVILVIPATIAAYAGVLVRTLMADMKRSIGES